MNYKYLPVTSSIDFEMLITRRKKDWRGTRRKGVGVGGRGRRTGPDKIDSWANKRWTQRDRKIVLTGQIIHRAMEFPLSNVI